MRTAIWSCRGRCRAAPGSAWPTRINPRGTCRSRCGSRFRARGVPTCGRIAYDASQGETLESRCRQAVADATSTRHKMKMNGMEHEMLMPGMLTDEEMAELDRARGPEFDRLFLIGMIKHHQGAIDMVDVLFKAYGAAQDETVFKFASDVYADQGIEIERMNKMLEDGGRPK